MNFILLLHHTRARAFPRGSTLQQNPIVVKSRQRYFRAFPKSDTLQRNSIVTKSWQGWSRKLFRSDALQQSSHSCVLRSRSLNLKILKGKELELANTIKRRKIKITCLQEVKYVWEKIKFISHEYKLFYMGKMRNKNGVG